MIYANELTFTRVNHNDTQISWSIKIIITITTIFLILLLVYYHYLDLKLYSIQNSFPTLCIALTKTKFGWIIFEILICAIHPIPRSYPLNDPEEFRTNATYPHSLSQISIDVLLGLPSKYFFGLV